MACYAHAVMHILQDTLFANAVLNVTNMVQIFRKTVYALLTIAKIEFNVRKVAHLQF